MLPPQLRSGTAVSKHRIGCHSAWRASSTTGIRASTACTQSRSFWKGHRRWDWVSQLDPMYQHQARLHTYKTRVKLLKSIRRRGAFEWDHGTRPFFTPRHLRWASHWRGRQWYTNDDPKQQIKEEAAAEEEKRAEEDGYELSRREKEWKDQMEAMRKRIAQDPYEAIFGKRFEPFWSPLVPSWMREEMGLQGWPTEKIQAVERNIASVNKDQSALNGKLSQLRKDLRRNQEQTSESIDTRTRKPTESKTKTSDDTANSPQGAATESSKPFSRMTREERLRHVRNTENEQRHPEPASTRLASPKTYAYASSTSWDSVTNKTKKVEWDSESNRTKRFEYDPVSNRMVEVNVPDKVAIDSDSSAVRQSISSIAAGTSRSESDHNKAVEIPAKQSSDPRKSIPIPPPLSQPSHSITLGYSQTSIGPLRSTAVSSASIKPAALARLPTHDLDMLTADRVRASMGKTKETEPAAKATTLKEKAELERSFDSNARSQDPEVEAILQERAATKEMKNAASAWDRAEMMDIFEREVDSLHKKKEKLMKDERGLFHIERQKRELQKLDERIKAVTKRVESMNVAVVESINPPALQTSLQRAEAKQNSPLLQPSVERMQSRDLPRVQDQDLDDAAAHECTEAVDAHKSVPKQWTKAAELLQADRVKRTASKRPYPMTRWIDDMNSRKVAYEHRKAEAQAAEDAKNAESNAKLEKVNMMLEAEVAEQKFKMQAFEGRYAQKVKSLRGELDTAFKQSSVHSEKHLERIRELESQLGGLRDKESKYAAKVKNLREELDRAYKQSAVHAEKHVERIRSLEADLQTALQKRAVVEQAEPQVLPGEGDLCINAPKFVENGKWYKRPATSLPRSMGIEKQKTELNDRALVEEVQSIYENEYGIIDENHEQRHVSSKEALQARKAQRGNDKTRQVVEVESDVDLGDELAKYEKENPQVYRFQESLTLPESTEKMKGVIADSLQQEFTTGKQGPKSSAAIQWTEPPLYKVLAYDSGNDMMSSATTTTSVLPGSAEERPLGIPEALSQLYQPARFVPYFAELQRDNFQAIAATREVIVFRQVKKATEPKVKFEGSARPKPSLQDHGLEKLRSNLESSFASGSNEKSQVNPIDGTSRRHLEPTTGNFASPTGFVNHDPVFPPEEPEAEGRANGEDGATTSDTYSTIIKEPTSKTARQIWESLPGSSDTPVKRTESVFSGMTKKERSQLGNVEQRRGKERNRERNGMSKAEKRQQYRRAQEQEDADAKKGSWSTGAKQGGNTLKYMLGAGLTTASAMYLVGTLAERERGPVGPGDMSRMDERVMWERERLRKRDLELERKRLENERQRFEDEAARLTKEWQRR